MAEFQNFRSALGGFNREDVVHYIEFINNKHAAQLNQLKTELAEQRRINQEAEDLSAQLADAREQIAALEQELEAARAAAPKSEKTEDELEAYRRAERAERRAAERVAQLYDQANAALADAATRADTSAAQVGQLADSLNLQLQQLLSAIASGKSTLLDAAAAMYAVRPLSEEE